VSVSQIRGGVSQWACHYWGVGRWQHSVEPPQSRGSKCRPAVLFAGYVINAGVLACGIRGTLAHYDVTIYWPSSLQDLYLEHNIHMCAGGPCFCRLSAHFSADSSNPYGNLSLSCTCCASRTEAALCVHCSP